MNILHTGRKSIEIIPRGDALLPNSGWRRVCAIFDLCESILQGDDSEYCAPIYFQDLLAELPDLTFGEIAIAIRDATRGDYSIAFTWDHDKRDWVVGY